MIWMVVILAWIACAVGALGFTVGYFDSKYPGSYRETLGTAVLFSAAGPVGLVIAVLLSGLGEYGWRIRPKKSKQP